MIMKKSTTLRFLDALSSNLKCCILSKRTVSKSNFLRFDIRMMLPFIFMALMLMNNTVYGQANVKGNVPVAWPTGGFGVDGDAFANQPPITGGSGVGDWWPFSPGSGGSVFTSGGAIIEPPVGTKVVNFIDKYKGDTEDDITIFAQSDKINDNPETYLVKAGSVPPKDDMQHGIGLFTWGKEGLTYINKDLLGNDISITGDPDDLWCLFAADRWKVNGSSYVDFEFNQKAITLDPITGLFTSDADDATGGRTPGDILVTIEFTGGGSTGSVWVDTWSNGNIVGAPYEWTTVDLTSAEYANSIFVTHNDNTEKSPWPIFDQTSPFIYEIDQYAEGAINLSEIFGGAAKCGHIATVWIRTKSSHSESAQLKDLCGIASLDVGATPPVALCPAPVELSACTTVDINKAFADWKAGFKPKAGEGTEPITPTFTPALPESLPANAECGYTFTTTYSLKDACDKIDSCTSTFTIKTPSAVVVTKAVDGGAKACDLKDQAAADALFATWLATAKVSGGCNPTSVPDKTTAPAYCGGSVTVTWTIADKCYDGMTYSATYTITPPPEVKIVKAEDKEVCSYENQAEADFAFAAWLQTASVSGGCDPTSTPDITTAPVYNGGSQKVTWTIDDKCYTASYFATFTINPLPKITCPVDKLADVDCGVSAKVAQDNANAAFATWFAQFATLNPGFNPDVAYDYTPDSAQPASGTAPVIPVIGTPALASPTSVTVTWTITDENGCKNSCNAKYELNYKCAPDCDATVTANVKCNGGSEGSISANGTNGSPLYTISLFNGFPPNISNPPLDSKTDVGEGVNVDFTGLKAGTYSIIVTDAATTLIQAKVCQATILEPDPVTLEISSKNVTCNGNANGKLSIDIFSGTGDPVFSLSKDGGAFTEMLETDIESATYGPGKYEIKVCYPDGNGVVKACCLTKPTEITEPTAVEATDASTKAKCVDGKDGTVTLTFSGGTPPYMVKFNGGEFATQTSPKTYEGLAVGTYDWIVKDANDCQVPGSEDVGYIPCEKALCTYTQGYYGNIGGMSCAEGKPYTTTALITKALGYYGGTMVVGYGLNTVSISTPSCVITVMPGGGGSYKLSGAKDICSLPSSYLKNGRINNTLLSQTIALGLNIGINSELGDFALKAGTLAIAMPDGGCGTDIPKLRSCSAEGYAPTINEYKYVTIPAVVDLLPIKTVQGLLDMANKALGGEVLPAGISLANLASAVDVINNAFDGCRISMGYDQKPLVCNLDNPESFVAFEVPIVNNQLIVKYKFAYVSDVTIDVFDTTGVKVFSKADTGSYLDKEVVLNYNFNTGTQKVYIIRVTTKLGHSEQKVVSSPY